MIFQLLSKKLPILDFATWWLLRPRLSGLDHNAPLLTTVKVVTSIFIVNDQTFWTILYFNCFMLHNRYVKEALPFLKLISSIVNQIGILVRALITLVIKTSTSRRAEKNSFFFVFCWYAILGFNQHEFINMSIPIFLEYRAERHRYCISTAYQYSKFVSFVIIDKLNRVFFWKLI